MSAMNRSKISRRTHDLTECTVGDSEYRNVLNRRASINKTHIFREGAAFDLADGAGAYA